MPDIPEGYTEVPDIPEGYTEVPDIPEGYTLVGTDELVSRPPSEQPIQEKFGTRALRTVGKGIEWFSGLPGIKPIQPAVRLRDAIAARAFQTFMPTETEIEKLLPIKAPTGNPVVDAWNTATRLVVRQQIPVPSPQFAKTAVELAMPVAPIDVVGYLLPELRAVKGLLAARVAKTAKVAPRVVETVEQAADRLSNLAKNVAEKTPKPLIEIFPAYTPKQTLVEALETAKARLPAEVALQGQAQVGTSARSVIDEALEALEKGEVIGPAKTQRVMHWVADGIIKEEIPWETGARLLGRTIGQPGYSKQQAASDVVQMFSEAGRTLYQASRVRNMMAEAFKDSPEALRILDKIAEPTGFWVRMMDGVRRVESNRLGLMVAQLGTSAGNFLSQGFTASLGTIEHTMDAALGLMTRKVTPSQALDITMSNVMGAYGQLTKTGRARFDAVFSAFPATKIKLLQEPISELAIDQKFVRTLNTVGYWQESFFRKMGFDARNRQILVSRGFNPTDLKMLTADDVKDSLYYGLKVAYAAPPETAVGRGILQIYHALPFLRAIGPTFPKFMLNGMKMLYDYSPFPLIPGVGTYKAMLNPDPVKAFGAFNKAMLGLGLIGTGYGLDQAGYVGPKWYQIKNKKGKILFDMRRYFPFTGHLFTGVFLSRVSTIGWDNAVMQLSRDDWMQAFVSNRRTQLSGIPILDAFGSSPFDTSSPEKFKDSMIRLGGNYVGSFITPVRMLGDVAASFVEGEDITRTTRESPFLGPALVSIPFARQKLPPQPQPLRRGPRIQEMPWLRQLGLAYTIDTPVETEAKRLGIEVYSLYPKTGSAEFDRIIMEKMGPLAEDALSSLMESESYQKAEMPRQRALFDEQLSVVKRAAKEIASGDRPDLALEELRKRTEARRKKLGL